PEIEVTACLDEDRLKVSVQFDRPVTGYSSLSLYSDMTYFAISPNSPVGSYAHTESPSFSSAVDRLDFDISVISMPVGSRIEVNFIYYGGIGAGRRGALTEDFDLTVPECVPAELLPPTETPTSTPNPDGTPAIINSTCLNNQQLMIVFEFQQPVTGLYEVIVNGVPYQLTPVPDQPNRLFFFGAAPPGGGMSQIVMRSLPDQSVVLKVADYSVPQCDFQSPNQPGGGDDYVPPPLP
ncbi:MAG: hypothetical protein L0287_01060, partial [Anaerolineae bacterium]|nr:hypothetical protein [Anaerolineae bacterium]